MVIYVGDDLTIEGGVIDLNQIVVHPQLNFIVSLATLMQ